MSLCGAVCGAVRVAVCIAMCVQCVLRPPFLACNLCERVAACVAMSAAVYIVVCVDTDKYNCTCVSTHTYAHIQRSEKAQVCCTGWLRLVGSLKL